MTVNEKAAYGFSVVAFGLSLFVLFMLLTMPKPFVPEPVAKKANYGVEIDCSGVPHETQRGRILMLSGLTGDDLHTVSISTGDLKRDIDTKGKLCSVMAVELP